jgi:SOS-response transcriptional repressor LexA
LDVNKSDVLAICDRTRSDSTAVPLYEGKMLHQFDHRFGTYAGQTVAQANQRKLPEATLAQHNDPSFENAPFYWVSRANADAVLSQHWPHKWLLAWRDITSANLERTVTATILPRVPTDFTVRVGFLHTAEPAMAALFLVAVFNGFVFDYMARLAIGGNHLSDFILRQLPILPPTSMSAPAPWAPQIQLANWLTPRVLELVYTAHDLAGFARDLGRDGPPFRWDEERRFLLRCELDAAFFHLYLPAEANGGWRRAEGETAEGLARLKASFPTPRDTVAYIMDSFPIVRRKDEEKFDGDYRTKRVILQIYDALAESIRTGQPYQTVLDPPPADPRVAHGPRLLEQPKVPALAQTPTVGALDESRVLRRVTPRRNDRYATCIPRLDLKAAAGGFSDDQDPEFEEWVEVNPSHALRKGMFVARVVGRSMEPLIPDGAYCLFQFKAPQVRNDLVGLFQLYSAEDPELGGRFTVKKLKVSARSDLDEGLRRVATLVPENPMFEPIPVAADDIKLVAEFLEVLRPFAELTGDDQIRVNP